MFMISGHHGQNVRYHVVEKEFKHENGTALPHFSDIHRNFRFRSLVETIQVPR